MENAGKAGERKKKPGKCSWLRYELDMFMFLLRSPQAHVFLSTDGG